MIFDLIFFVCFVIFSNYILIKKNYLPSFTGQKHQILASENSVPLSGGIFLLIIISHIYLENINIVFLFFLFFFLGFLGDINILRSPKKRLLIQLFLVCYLVLNLDLNINSTRINFIDNLLEENWIISYFFTIFCILVLINGSNFIDGLNGLLIGYLLIVILIIFKLNYTSIININLNLIYFLILTLVLLLFLNFFNLFFLGDSGSYLVGIFLSYILIKTHMEFDNQISPYFIILLLWYPCFENLFSFMRKNKIKFSPTKPDNNHLHQLLFIFLRNKLNTNIIFSNVLTSILINSFNFFVLILGAMKPYATDHQLLLLVFNIIIYLTLYSILGRLRKLQLVKK